MQATNEAVDYAELMGTIFGLEQKIKLYEHALKIIAMELTAGDDMSALAQQILRGDTELLNAFEEHKKRGL